MYTYTYMGIWPCVYVYMNIYIYIYTNILAHRYIGVAPGEDGHCHKEGTSYICLYIIYQCKKNEK